MAPYACGRYNERNQCLEASLQGQSIHPRVSREPLGSVVLPDQSIYSVKDDASNQVCDGLWQNMAEVCFATMVAQG